MTTTFAAVAQHPFEPGVNIDAGTTGVKHTTSDAWAVKLRGMALINGIEGRVKYKLASAGGGAGSVTIELRIETSSGAVLLTKSVVVASGETETGIEEIDLGSVGGATGLKMVAEVTTEDSGETLDVFGQLETASPVIVGGC